MQANADLAAAFVEYGAAIHNYIAKRVADPAEAAELASHVWEKVVRAGTRPDNPRAFLHACAHNAIVDHYRRQAQAPEQVPLDGVAASQDTAHAAIVRADAAAVLRVIDRLTPAQAAVLRLRFLEGHTLLETAAILNIQPGAVKALQARACDTVRALLGLKRMVARRNRRPGRNAHA